MVSNLENRVGLALALAVGCQAGQERKGTPEGGEKAGKKHKNSYVGNYRDYNSFVPGNLLQLKQLPGKLLYSCICRLTGSCSACDGQTSWNAPDTQPPFFPPRGSRNGIVLIVKQTKNEEKKAEHHGIISKCFAFFARAGPSRRPIRSDRPPSSCSRRKRVPPKPSVCIILIKKTATATSQSDSVPNQNTRLPLPSSFSLPP